MATWKKIVYSVAAVIVFAGYIALAAFVLNTFFAPTDSDSDGIISGAYLIANADSETDPEIDNDETVFDNIDGGLLYSDDSVLSGLKMVTLYEISLAGDPAEEGSEVAIEISDELYKDDTLAIVCRRDDLSIGLVASRREVRTKETGEEYNVIIFDVSDPGYYGIVAQRRIAHYDWLLASFCIVTVVGLFFVLFVAFKKKTETYRSGKE